MDPMERLWISRASLHSKRGKNVWYHGTFKFDGMSFQRAGAVSIKSMTIKRDKLIYLIFHNAGGGRTVEEGVVEPAIFPSSIYRKCIPKTDLPVSIPDHARHSLTELAFLSGQHNHVVRLRATAKSYVCFKYYCFCYK